MNVPSFSNAVTRTPFNSVLVIKLRYVGDVLLATPVLQAVRAAFPSARLTMVVNSGTEDMIRHNRDVHEVLTLPRGSWTEQLRFLRGLRRRRFDCVLDLTDGDRAAWIAWFTGARLRIGFNEEHRWRGRLYTHVAAPPPRAHRIEHDLSILEPLGVASSATVPRLDLSPEDEREGDRILGELGVRTGPGEPALIMLQPAARYWFKAWPEDRFATLADRLVTEQGSRVLIGGSASDRELAERIGQRMKTVSTVLAGRTTLLQYAAIVKRCALFVGNDSGAMHIAAAMKTPLVALFGPSNPQEWGPRGGSAEVIYKELDCRVCFHPTCRRGEENCMRLIDVDEVYAAAIRMMRKKEYVSGCA